MDPVQAQLERAVEWLQGDDPDQQYQVNLLTTSTSLPCLATAWQDCDAVTHSVVSMQLGSLHGCIVRSARSTKHLFGLL